jgi:hypothetical protein
MKFVILVCFAMGAMLLPSCGGGLSENKQHSTPALDSLLADTALLGEEAIAPANETEEGTPSNVKPAKIKMANDLDYSADFLKKLTYANLAKNIELADSFIILEQTDTFVFPMLLPKAKWTNFVASKQGYLYSLDVSRVNYTTLDFNFELRKGRQTVDQIRGKADLNPGFVLASEPDEDESTGSTYPANDYYSESPECTFSIRVGDDMGIKKVKLIKLCKSEKYNIALENSPILLEK